MHDRLGHWFRHRYGRLLSTIPKHTEIEVMSTGKDRTINSAMANMAGLYYLANTTDRYNPLLPFTPVPVHSVPLEYDKVSAQLIYNLKLQIY